MKKQNSRKIKGRNVHRKSRLIRFLIALALLGIIGIFLYHRFSIQKSIHKEQVKPYEPPFTKNG
jgi:hypothetical protein